MGEPKDQSSTWKEFIETMMDLSAGTVGGCSGIVVGQPLDTVKVRLQSAEKGTYKGAIDCFLKIVRREGPLALFKGMQSPLLGNAPINAIAFGAYGNMNRLLEPYLPSESGKGGAPNYSRLFLAGCWAGLAQCIVATPVELIKCKLQVQSETVKYKGPWDCMKQSINASGLRLGLYRGFWSTVWRDMPAYGAYFVAYEYSKYQLIDRLNFPTMGGLLLSGGIAGVATWVSTYPIDVIKSVAQTLPDTAKPSEASLIRIAKDIYQREGWRGFTKGLGTTILRSVPTNAVTFLVYQSTVDWMRTVKP